ncbi:PAAR domain-containing protein [Paraburkholderia humisilvae]|uniref:PAAR domain-containing protein n=1 Tax=Paraburkholderia humisilvae TaxID=627669 RepID=UPI0031B58CC3
MVRHGDPTTTGGFVIALTSTLYDGVKQLALNGDEATCGNCKGRFKIFGTGTGMSEGTRLVVIDGDLVLCPCNRNRVIVGKDPGIFLDVDAAAATCNPNTAATTSSIPGQIHDEQFTLRDRRTNLPLANVRYRIRSVSGEVAKGRTDAIGRTARIKCSSPEQLILEIASDHRPTSTTGL